MERENYTQIDRKTGKTTRHKENKKSQVEIQTGRERERDRPTNTER